MDNDLISKEEEKEVLLSMAIILKRNCEKYEHCDKCPIYDRYKPEHLHGKTCPFFNSNNPEDWLVH